jgi:hypothetical protein
MDLSRRDLMRWFGTTSVGGLILPMQTLAGPHAEVSASDLIIPVGPVLPHGALQIPPGGKLVINNIRVILDTNLGSFEAPPEDGPRYPVTIMPTPMMPPHRSSLRIHYDSGLVGV